MPDGKLNVILCFCGRNEVGIIFRRERGGFNLGSGCEAASIYYPWSFFKAGWGDMKMGIQVRQAQAVNSCKRHILPWCLTLLCQKNSAGKDNSTWAAWQTRNRVCKMKPVQALAFKWVVNLEKCTTPGHKYLLFLNLKSWST